MPASSIFESPRVRLAAALQRVPRHLEQRHAAELAGAVRERVPRRVVAVHQRLGQRVAIGRLALLAAARLGMRRLVAAALHRVRLGEPVEDGGAGRVERDAAGDQVVGERAVEAVPAAERADLAHAPALLGADGVGVDGRRRRRRRALPAAAGAAAVSAARVSSVSCLADGSVSPAAAFWVFVRHGRSFRIGRGGRGRVSCRIRTQGFSAGRVAGLGRADTALRDRRRWRRPTVRAAPSRRRARARARRRASRSRSGGRGSRPRRCG